MDYKMLQGYRRVVENAKQPAVRLRKQDLLAIVDDALFGHIATNEYKLLEERLVSVLDVNDLWNEDGTFTFPDGETYYRKEPL